MNVSANQKRLGTRLRKLKMTTKGLKALTDAVIDKLQNYFGMALRANTGGTVQKMADAIWSSFLHVSSNEKHQYHSLYDKTWCRYRRDEANNTNLFKHGPGLPNDSTFPQKHCMHLLISIKNSRKVGGGELHYFQICIFPLRDTPHEMLRMTAHCWK